MQKEEFAHIVRLLHQPEVYFGRVEQLYEASGFSYHEAWLHLENQRAEFGLPPRYSTFNSYRAAKTKHHQSNGLIIIPSTWPDS